MLFRLIGRALRLALLAFRLFRCPLWRQFRFTTRPLGRSLALGLRTLLFRFLLRRSASAEVLPIHAQRAAAAGGFRVVGSEILEDGYKPLRLGGGDKFLVNDLAKLVGAHGEGRGKPLETIFGGILRRLLQALAIAGTAAIDVSFAPGVGGAYRLRPVRRIPFAFNHLDALIARPRKKGLQPMPVFLVGMNIRVHIANDQLITLFFQQAHRFKRAGTAAGVEEYLHGYPIGCSSGGRLRKVAALY